VETAAFKGKTIVCLGGLLDKGIRHSTRNKARLDVNKGKVLLPMFFHQGL